MNQKFWNLFGNDYTRNCLKWQHSPQNPVLPKTGTEFGFKSHWTANPDILEFKGRRLLYYRGNGVLEDRPGEHHDRLAVAELLGTDENGGLCYRDLNEGNILFDAGGDLDFDYHVLDPSAVIFQDKVFLYYSATSQYVDSVGLALSEDGEHFTKYGSVMAGRAPAAVVWKDKIYMVTQYRGKLFLFSSGDGIRFRMEAPLEGFFKPGTWDAHAITTFRIYQEGDVFYAMYGGSAYLEDEPDYFGLARSADLIHWETHPGNPIFGCGPKGAPDGGAIWFPALFEEEHCFSMLYEGSRGKYSWDLSSEICLARIPKDN